MFTARAPTFVRIRFAHACAQYTLGLDVAELQIVGISWQRRPRLCESVSPTRVRNIHWVSTWESCRVLVFQCWVAHVCANPFRPRVCAIYTETRRGRVADCWYFTAEMSALPDLVRRRCVLRCFFRPRACPFLCVRTCACNLATIGYTMQRLCGRLG